MSKIKQMMMLGIVKQNVKHGILRPKDKLLRALDKIEQMIENDDLASEFEYESQIISYARNEAKKMLE